MYGSPACGLRLSSKDHWEKYCHEVFSLWKSFFVFHWRLFSILIASLQTFSHTAVVQTNKASWKTNVNYMKSLLSLACIISLYFPADCVNLWPFFVKGWTFSFFYFDSIQCSKTLSHQQCSWSDQLWAGYRSRPGNNCCPWATNIKSNSLHTCDSNSRRGVLLSTKLQAGGLLQASVERTHVYSEARSGWQHNCEVLHWW